MPDYSRVEDDVFVCPFYKCKEFERIIYTVVQATATSNRAAKNHPSNTKP